MPRSHSATNAQHCSILALTSVAASKQPLLQPEIHPLQQIRLRRDSGTQDPRSCPVRPDTSGLWEACHGCGSSPSGPSRWHFAAGLTCAPFPCSSKKNKPQNLKLCLVLSHMLDGRSAVPILGSHAVLLSHLCTAQPPPFRAAPSARANRGAAKRTGPLLYLTQTEQVQTKATTGITLARTRTSSNLSTEPLRALLLPHSGNACRDSRTSPRPALTLHAQVLPASALSSACSAGYAACRSPCPSHPAGEPTQAGIHELPSQKRLQRRRPCFCRAAPTAPWDCTHGTGEERLAEFGQQLDGARSPRAGGGRTLSARTAYK